MKQLIIILIALLLACIVPADTTSADPGWDWYRDITINATLVPSTQTNFPVLLSLNAATHGAWLKDTGETGGHIAQTDGGDIRFTDTSNTVLYDYEIESYNSTTGTLVVWIEIPSVDGSTDTNFRMWYGNAAAADGWNVTGVWDSNFKGVWHLTEDASGTGTADFYQDSTTNNNDGDDYVSSTVKTGKIGAGQDFDGSVDYINVGSIGTISNDTFSVSAWVRPDNVTGRKEIVWAAVSGGSDERFILEVDTGTITFKDDYGMTVVGGTIAIGNWYYAVATYDYTNQQAYVYVDGAYKASDTSFSQASTTLGDLEIGAKWNGEYYLLDGIIDEVRISNIARSADWITTEYNNQSDTTVGASYFIKSLGTETDVSAGEDPIPELPTIVLMSMGWWGWGLFVAEEKGSVVSGQWSAVSLWGEG